MKYLMILVALAALAMGRSKDQGTYTVVAQNTSADPAQLEIDNEFYTVTRAGFKKEVYVDKYDFASLSLGYVGAGTQSLSLSVYKGDELITTVTGNTYMYVLLSRDTAMEGGGGLYRHAAALPNGDLYL
jgi:hypothetical protein